MSLPRLHSRLVALLAFVVALACSFWLLPVRAEEKKAEADKPPKVRLDFYGDPLPNGAVARIGCVHLRHAGIACDVAFQDQGKTIVSTGAGDPLIRYWDAERGKTIRTVAGQWHVGGKLSPDGKLLSRGATIWNIASGKIQFDEQLTGSLRQGVDFHESIVAISPDGKRAAVSHDQDVFIWDTGSGKKLHDLKGHKYAITALAFSPDGTVLASADQFNEYGGPPGAPKDPTGSVRLWDVEKGKEIRQLEGHEESVAGISFSPDGKRLAAGGRVSTLVWDLTAAKPTSKRYKVRAEVLTFSPDGQHLAAAYGGVFVVDLADRENHRMLTGEPIVGCRATAFSPDGKTVAAALEDGQICLWDLKTGKELLRPFPGHPQLVGGRQANLNSTGAPSHGLTEIHLTVDGKRAVTCAADSTLCIWDTGNGKLIGHFNPQGSGEGVGPHTPACRCAISPDGRYVAATGQRGFLVDDIVDFLKVWEVESGKEVRTIEGHGKSYVGFTNLVFLPGAKILATDRSHLRCWDVTTGAECQILDADEKKVEWFGISGDGRTLVVSETQQSRGPGRPRAALVGQPLRLWDLETGKRKPFDVDLVAAVKQVGLDALGHRFFAVTNAVDLGGPGVPPPAPKATESGFGTRNPPASCESFGPRN